MPPNQPSAPASVPAAVDACHQLLAWLVPQLDHFPRARRFTLGDKLECALLDVLEQLIDAAYQGGEPKRQALRTANRKLTLVRHLWRLAHEMEVLAFKPYHHGATLMVELGQQVGGWQRASARGQ